MRVVLAEDLFLLRDGLIRTLLEHGFDVVAAVDNGPSLRQALIEQEPDVAVIDVRLPPPTPMKGCRSRSKRDAVAPACPSWCYRST